MRFQGKKVKIENRNYANKNTHQQICHATFLENRFNLAVLEMICVIFTNLVKYSANKKPPNQKCWHNISLDLSLTHPENRPHCLFIPETENQWLSWFVQEGWKGAQLQKVGEAPFAFFWKSLEPEKFGAWLSYLQKNC